MNGLNVSNPASATKGRLQLASVFGLHLTESNLGRDEGVPEKGESWDRSEGRLNSVAGPEPR